jgi:hypothetical protein
MVLSRLRGSQDSLVGWPDRFPVIEAYPEGFTPDSEKRIGGEPLPAPKLALYPGSRYQEAIAKKSAFHGTFYGKQLANARTPGSFDRSSGTD